MNTSKACTGCHQTKTLDEFYPRAAGKHGRAARCIACDSKRAKAYRSQNPEKWRASARDWHRRSKQAVREGDARLHAYWLLYPARRRAKTFGVPFSLKAEDVVVPKTCPALGIPLVMARGRMCENSATLDRIIPALGYVPGNVIVVSAKANTIKSNATPKELALVAAFYNRAHV